MGKVMRENVGKREGIVQNYEGKTMRKNVGKREGKVMRGKRRKSINGRRENVSGKRGKRQKNCEGKWAGNEGKV